MRDSILGFEKKLSVTAKWAAVLFFSVGCLTYALELSLRLFGGKSLYWLSPWIPYFFVMASLYGAAYAVRTNENIKVEVLRQWSKSPMAKKMSNALSLMISLLLLSVFYQNFSHSLAKEGFSFVQDIPYLHLFLVTVVSYATRIFWETEEST